MHKLIVSLRLRHRDELMMLELMRNTHARLANPLDVLVITDGFVPYQSHYPMVFSRSHLTRGHEPCARA